MIVINALSANDALSQGLELMYKEGIRIPSRAGETIEVPEAVTTVYKYPKNMVLMSKVRDANPFFHLMESLWILAGRQDTKFLCEFNSQMINYSDDGKTFNAPYGHRLRNSTDAGNCDEDQLEEIISILKNNPGSRQVIGQIWDPKDLSNTETKDKACNMQVVLRVRKNGTPFDKGTLDLTVYNRSNDIIWGAYGANIVQFSTLLEYVSARTGIPMGTYTQVSNSYHVYTEGLGGKLYNNLRTDYNTSTTDDPYLYVENRVWMNEYQMEEFDGDLKYLFAMYDGNGLEVVSGLNYWKSDYFKDLVIPMLRVFVEHKTNGPVEALSISHEIKADDWRRAAQDWLEVRIEKRKAKQLGEQKC